MAGVSGASAAGAAGAAASGDGLGAAGAGLGASPSRMVHENPPVLLKNRMSAGAVMTLLSPRRKW